MPTLPTPTTLRARSTSWNWSSRIRRSWGSVRLYSTQKPLGVRLDAIALVGIREVVEPDDQRRIGDDAPLAVDVARELRERLDAVSPERLGDGLVEALAHLAADLRAELGISFSISKRVYQTSRLRIAANSAIRVRYAATVSRTTRSWSVHREAAVSRSDQHADGEALDIPLPRAGERLVEVVDVEDEPPLGRGVEPEVREMRVAAALHLEAGARGGGQVGRHDQRRATVERERRGEHPAVADRHELGNARLCLALQQLDRVEPVRRRLEHGVARPRNLAPRRLPACDALRDASAVAGRRRSARAGPAIDPAPLLPARPCRSGHRASRL